MSEQLVFTYFKVTPFYQPLLKEGWGGVGGSRYVLITPSINNDS